MRKSSNGGLVILAFILFPIGILYLFVRPIIELVGIKDVEMNPPPIIALHIKTLARKKSQLTKVDDYGKTIATKWEKELEYFIENIVRPTLNFCASQANVDQLIKAEIERQIQRVDPAVLVTYDKNITPIQYEEFCAEVLRQVGWNARTTKASGDQGCDVYAENNGRVIILQCKLYNGAVGNAAVQEVVAAKGFYQANFAAVVTNLSYTQSAKQLARANHVDLLTDDTLSDWAEQMLPETERPHLLSQSA